MEMATNEDNEQQEKLIVAVCTVTGNQGRAIVKRFGQINQENSTKKKVQVRGLTRDTTSVKAQELQELAAKANDNDLLELVEVDYTSSKSLRKALKGTNALYLNCTISMTMPPTDNYNNYKLYQKIIDAAIQVGIEHIVYSSVVECDNYQKAHDNHVVVPHWECARHTEGYLAIRQDETNHAFVYHILRLPPLLNDNLLEKHSNTNQPPQEETTPPPATSAEVSWIAYPWQPSVRVHTASARDAARVACKLFCQPESLKDGAAMNIITDYRNPHEMAQYITLATSRPVQAYKGPATLTTIGHLLGYESRCLVAMGDYFEKHWTSKQYVKPLKFTMEDYLKEEIKEEPLECVEAFVQRNFGTKE